VRSEEAEQAPEAKAAQEVAAAQADADADAAEGRAGAEAAEDTDEKSCTAFDKPIEVFNEGCTERRRISRQRVAFAHG
jgi:hypothetical protein